MLQNLQFRICLEFNWTHFWCRYTVLFKIGSRLKVSFLLILYMLNIFQASGRKEHAGVQTFPQFPCDLSSEGTLHIYAGRGQGSKGIR